MLKSYLDIETYNAITSSFNFNDITELRLRVNQNLIVVVKNKKFFLKNNNHNYIIVTNLMIQNFIKKASENSLYAFNEDIINGYLSLPNGIRVGLGGEVVKENENVITIKNFQSVNIRIPHIVKNCSLPAYEFLVDSDVKNTLIISAPGCGKTTFLRDFIYQLNEHNISKNILIVDERNEICSTYNGVPMLDLGPFCDIYTHCSKDFAFNNGIRSMKPDVIVTDEINLESDINAIKNAIHSGVNVVASIHAQNIDQLKSKLSFSNIVENKLFSRYVVLTNQEGPGTLTHIYDENLNCIYCR